LIEDSVDPSLPVLGSNGSHGFRIGSVVAGGIIDQNPKLSRSEERF
jgi:hypothetical protein